jgi:hypothetical protein
MNEINDFDERFWEAWPRWRFINNWHEYEGTRTFGLLGVWWTKRGSMGVTVFNFGVEFNPHHKEKS